MVEYYETNWSTCKTQWAHCHWRTFVRFPGRTNNASESHFAVRSPALAWCALHRMDIVEILIDQSWVCGWTYDIRVVLQTFKHTHMKSRRNKRLDRLVHIVLTVYVAAASSAMCASTTTW